MFTKSYYTTRLQNAQRLLEITRGFNAVQPLSPGEYIAIAILKHAGRQAYCDLLNFQNWKSRNIGIEEKEQTNENY